MIGIKYGAPYLSKHLKETDDFIAVERWILPELTNFLDSINPDFYAHCICDKRIPIEPENRTR